MFASLKVVHILLSMYLCVNGSSVKDNMLLVEFGPNRLSSFSGIGDQVVLHWPAYLSIDRYLVQFSGSVNQTGSGLSVKCESVNVTANIRQNAIPIPNPRNAFIPEFTIIENDGYLLNESFLLSESTQENIYEVTFNVIHNKPTDFYVGLFLPYTTDSIDVSGLTKECKYYMTVKVYAIDTTVESFTGNQLQLSGVLLARQQKSLFKVVYLPTSYNFNLSNNDVATFYWYVFPLTDSGGTLDISLNVTKTLFSSSLPLTILGCLTNDGLLNQTDSADCAGIVLQVNASSSNDQITWHIPFPSSGTWNLTLTLQCDITAVATDCSNIVQHLGLSVSIGSCIDNCNADNYRGQCYTYRSDAILFAACDCKVGWIGLACNDGRYALSYYTQLLHTLLLTLSNIMFIPCVIVAIYRHFYTEALIYFFVTFMSTFYHACDQPGEVVSCIMPYETLQFSDFLSSITAIWFTLVAVAKLPTRIESFLQVLGLIAFAVCVSLARFNVWTTVVPAVVGVIIVISQWGIKCRELNHCYPGLKKTLFSIIPGVLFAGVGLILFAFVETDENYYIVHSMWHILMATAVLFLLPVNHRTNNISSFEVKPNTKISPNSTVNSGVSLVRNTEIGSMSNL